MRTLLVVILIFIGTYAFSQSTGSLAGYVLDKITEEPLIGAAVVVGDGNSGAVTDFNGFFIISGLKPGSYNISASYLGYRPDTKYNIIIKSVANPDITFLLDEVAIDLSTVVVRPDPFSKPQESPLSIQKLTTDEITAFPGGGNDIAKVVQAFPGVGTSLSGFRNDIIIRGGAPNEVVYYLDGIEIPNINHFATQGSGGGPVSLLNVSFFQGVSLNTSAFSAQYDNALSGVLQFDQRVGNTRDMRRNVRISGTEAALTLEGPLFKNDREISSTSYIVSARRSYLQFLFKLIDLPFLPDYWDFQAKVSHKIDPYNEITFVGIGSIDDFSINIPDDLTRESEAQLSSVPIIKQSSYTGGISWKHRIKEEGRSGFFLHALSLNTFNNHFERYSDNESQSGLYFTNKSTETELKLRSTFTTYVNRWKINTGGMIQRGQYNNETTDLTFNFDYETDLNLWKYGFFLQASARFFDDRLSGSAGFRFDGNTYTVGGNEFWRTFSPRLSLSYRLEDTDRWRLNASLGRYYKLPSYTLLGFQDIDGVNVNRSIKYIRSDHLVGGLEFVPRTSTRITLEAFYKKYSNYPVSLTKGVSLANLGADFEVFGNEPVGSIGLGRSYGLELSAQQKLTNDFYAIMAITLFRSEYTGLESDSYLPSLWDNKQLLSFTGGYKLGRNWELGAKFRYAGPSTFAPVDIEASETTYPEFILDYNSLGEERLSAFSGLDLRIDKKWNFDSWYFNVFLDVQNIYSATQPEAPVYVPTLGIDGDPITPLQLELLPDTESGQVLPTIGIIVEW